MAVSRGWLIVLVALLVVVLASAASGEHEHGVERVAGVHRNGVGQSGLAYHLLNSLEGGSPVEFPLVGDDQDEKLLEFYTELAAVLHHHVPTYMKDKAESSPRGIAKDIEKGKERLRIAGAQAMKHDDRTTLEVFMGWIAQEAQKLPAESRHEIKTVARRGLMETHSDKFLQMIKQLNDLSRAHLDRSSHDHRYSVYADIHVSRIQQLFNELSLKHVWRYQRSVQ